MTIQHHLYRVALSAALAGALTACSDTDEETQPKTAEESDAEAVRANDDGTSTKPDEHVAHATKDAGARAAEPLRLSIEIPDVQPGEEGTKCVQVRLPNEEVVSITKIHNTISTGSHHFILTALSDEAAEEAPLSDCRGFAGALAGAPLTITQSHDDTVKLPEGVGYRLHAGQVMHLEMHYINVTQAPIDIKAEAELFPADPKLELQDGSVLLVGTRDVNVPPRGTYQNEPKFLRLPDGMQDVKFYAITGHTHQYGTSVKVSSTDAEQQRVDELYAPERYDWELPEMKQLQPHVTIPQDGGFLLQCAWKNTSDHDVKWGESATAEMCFFWGYYYPRKDVVSIVLDDIAPAALKRFTASGM